MSRLPRIALGTVQPLASGNRATWALMQLLEESGLTVQSFQSRAHFNPCDAATVITGLCPRHLDTWMMSPAWCRELFLFGSRSSDLSVVDGRFAHDGDRQAPGGDLETLCEWLDLPRIAVLDAARLDSCLAMSRPRNLAGVLLDHVTDERQAIVLQTRLEGLWGVPVLGWLEARPALRAALSALPPGTRPSVEMCKALGQSLRGHCQLNRILHLAERDFSWSRKLPDRSHTEAAALNVAVAYDDAFHCYFPDVMDLLELQGASICDFSPLRDDRLPPDVDLVYIGCGRPDLFADELAANECMTLSLRGHVCSGKRLYAECGGLAYLGHSLQAPDGRTLRMAGALPLEAQITIKDMAPEPVELSLEHETWLAPAGSQLRGYLNHCFSFRSLGAMRTLAAGNEDSLNLGSYHNAIGSRLHVNFATCPGSLEPFFKPVELSRSRLVAQ